jgi:Domain of Unknown Function (DUF1080)
MKKIYSAILCIALSMLAQGQKSRDNELTRKEKKEWKLLFDGVSLKEWTTVDGKPVPAGWQIGNGCVTIKKGSKAGDIISAGEYSDFELSIDYNIEPGCNSGVKYFFTNYKIGGNLGMEYQIIDDIAGEDTRQANHLCGSFYDVLAPDESGKKANPPGQWNNMRIVVKGMNVEHWLNGRRILAFTRGSESYLSAVSQSKFSKTSPVFGMVGKGHILLQEHGGQVSFKNIRIKVLTK